MFAIVIPGKVASGDDAYAHRAKIVGRDEVNLHRRAFVRWRLGPALDQKGSIPTVVIQRDLIRDARTRDSWKGPNLFKECLIKANLIRMSWIFAFRKVCLKSQH